MNRSFNTKQREIFEVLNKWPRDHLKQINLKTKTKVEPIHPFVAGSAGIKKSSPVHYKASFEQITFMPWWQC